MSLETKKIAQFLKEYADYLDEELLEEIIEQHIIHKTIIIIYADKEKTQIIGVCRFNVPSIDTAKILDLVIHPDYRNQNLIERMLKHGLRIFPTVKYLEWERAKRVGAFERWEVNRILRRKKWEAQK